MWWGYQMRLLRETCSFLQTFDGGWARHICERHIHVASVCTDHSKYIQTRQHNYILQQRMRSLSYSLICSLKMWLICPCDSWMPDFLPRFGFTFASIAAVKCCWLWLLVSSDLFCSIEKKLHSLNNAFSWRFLQQLKFSSVGINLSEFWTNFMRFSGNFDSNSLQIKC